MIETKDIQDYIDDAFDTWPELNCNLDGLLGYVEEYNECFLEKKNNPERSAHVILFVKRALSQGEKISNEIMDECICEMTYVKKTHVDFLQDEISYIESKL